MEDAVSRAPARRCYKFLAAGGVGRFSNYRWPLPVGEQPGAWVSVHGDLEPCRNGVHACRLRDLPYWLDDELWAAEAAEPVLEHDGVLVARSARLLWRWGRGISWSRRRSRRRVPGGPGTTRSWRCDGRAASGTRTRWSSAPT